MGFGDRLKILRGNLNQDEFSSKVGFHKNTIGRWERGEQSPNVADVNRILATFPNINPTWLLTGEGEMKRGAVTWDFGMIGAGPPPVVQEQSPFIQDVNFADRQYQGEASGAGFEVDDKTAELIDRMLNEKSDKYGELTGGKAIILMTIVYRIYSRKFYSNADFRIESLDRVIDGLFRLALPTKGIDSDK